MECKLCGSDAEERYNIDDFKVICCGTCGLVFLNIVDNPMELEKVYSKDYFEERREYFFENKIADPEKENTNENIDDFSKSLDLIRHFSPHGKDLLDVGCGIGIFLSMARKENWIVSGVDISPYAIQSAKKLFNLNVHQGPLQELKLRSESFDVVTMWDSLEHMVDPVAELKEVCRILRKGGILLLDTPNERSLLRVIAQMFYKISFGTLNYPLKKLYHRYHLFYFSPSVLKKMMDVAGYDVLTLRKKPIPLIKARGSGVEKVIVKFLSLFERILGREYELFIVAQKRK